MTNNGLIMIPSHTWDFSYQNIYILVLKTGALRLTMQFIIKSTLDATQRIKCPISIPGQFKERCIANFYHSFYYKRIALKLQNGQDQLF